MQEANAEALKHWGFFKYALFVVLTMLFPIFGIVLGLYGLCHKGVRLEGFVLLCGGIYMTYKWSFLWFLF